MRKKHELELEPSISEVEGIADLSGVGDVAEGKLREAGFDTIEMLAVALPEDLTQLNLEAAQARKIIDAARKHIDRVGIKFQTADVIMREHQERFRLLTGVQSLDEMIGGGLEASTVSIAHGKYGHGKTQLSHQIAACALVNAELKHSKVLYIDTENTFRPERLLQLVTALGGDKSTLSRVIHAEAHSSSHQQLIIDHTGSVVKKENVRVLIVDSLTAHFRSEFIGREMLARRQQTLNKHLQKISQLTRMFNLITFVTTQEIDVPAQGYMGAAESRGAGGNVLFHRGHMILSIWKPDGMSEKRFLTLEKHPSLPQQKIVLRLNEQGFSDFDAKPTQKKPEDATAPEVKTKTTD
jgi:DNA repair protein RadA